MKEPFSSSRGILHIKLSIASKLILSYLLIIIFISGVFIVIGIYQINHLIVSEAQDKVRYDLNSAREIYLSRLTHIHDVIRLTAERFFLKEALLSGNIEQIVDELVKIRKKEELDILTVTDQNGRVLLRTSNISLSGDDQSHDALVKRVLETKTSFASTVIISGKDLEKESPVLARQAHIKFIDTPMARYREEKEETSGMMLKAAAPILDSSYNLIGVLYGGVLLNRNYKIVDKIKQTVFKDMVYKNKDIGTSTIFQDDVRISTNVKNKDGTRAIGTRLAEDVYNQVIIKGQPWIGRAYVVNDWYITAYEPIRDIDNKVIGILYVGILEQKYVDIKKQTIATFMAITVAGTVVALIASILISRRILKPIYQLMVASRLVAQGNLDVQVEINTRDELQDLAESFNIMSQALKKRDEQLKEYATKKIMESERLALIGQLTANVAHELNNPLQGIVAYSHLLLEKIPCEDPTRNSLEKIVGQANRCRDIIRGLLDFSRQRKPEKTLSNINSILEECISLVENQDLFHNIEIIKNFQDDLPLIIIDPSQIERVFMNLIINAAEAIDNHGQLTLATRYDPVNECIEIEFTDTGHGISQENIGKIFDPFFTTKEVGRGTGLGLAISYGIVKAHHGTISVKSQVGKGTTFIVKLPLKAKEGVNNGY